MAGEIHHEIRSAVHANTLHCLPREKLFAYSSALAKGDAYAYYSEKEFPAVRDLVARALEHSFDTEANRSASEANRIAHEANNLALEANRVAVASKKIASLSVWTAIAGAIIAAIALAISLIPLFK